MGKRASWLDLAVTERPSATPRFTWLYGELRRAIAEGRLRRRTRLPSTRGLARQHGLSRGTVVAAFEQLAAEGYVTGRVGAGTYVADALPDDFLVSGPARDPRDRLPTPLRLSRRGEELARTPFALAGRSGGPRAFVPCRPAIELFPVALWQRLAGHRQRRGLAALLGDGDAHGYRPLREAIAAYVGTRGVRCVAEQVVVVSGVQQGLDLTARLLLDPGDLAWVEDPGYPGVTTLAAAGARLVPVPVDAQGLDVAAGERRAPDARLAYVTPGRQWPLGMAMSLERRLALLRWARRARAVVFEDDYDSEYRYASRPLAALQGLDDAGRVVYAGTFSKLLFPSLRLGFLVVPPPLVDAFAAARSVLDRYSSLTAQAVLCDFIVEGHLARHVRRMREIYAGRREALLTAARQELGGLIDVTPCDAGLETIGWLPPGAGDTAAAAAAAARGVDSWPLSPLAHEVRVRPGLLLGFAAVDEPVMRPGAQHLAAALASLRDRSARLRLDRSRAGSRGARSPGPGGDAAGRPRGARPGRSEKRSERAPGPARSQRGPGPAGAAHASHCRAAKLIDSSTSSGRR